MKKLNKLFAILIAVLGVQTLSAQTDVTEQYLTNAGFDDETSFVNNGVCTYAKDCSANETTLSQMQPVNGWTFGVANGDARASGAYAWGATHFLGGQGYTIPSTDEEGNIAGGALGICAVWNAVLYYYQEVTLAPGVYELSYCVYNSGSGANTVDKNLFGFIADNGVSYYGATKTFTSNSWTKETISFTLATETKGKISVGIDAANAGSGGSHHLFVDYIKLTHKSFDDVSAENPADFTSLIVNPSFENGNLDGWTVGGYSSDTGVKSNSNGTYTTSGVDGNYLFNTWWQGTPLTQTVGNIPNGIYELKVLLASDQNAKLFLLANDEHSEVYTITTDNKTFHDVSYEFKVLNGQAKIGVVGGNDAGEYLVNGHWWYKADNFRLIYKGADLFLLQEAFNANYTNLENLSTGDVPTAFAQKISNLISTYETAPTSKKDLTTANTAIESVVNAHPNIVTAYGSLKNLISTCNSLKTISTAFTDVAATEFTNAIETTDADADAATTVTELNNAYNTLEEARRTYMQNAYPTSGNTLDFSYLIANADWEGNTGSFTTGEVKHEERYNEKPWVGNVMTDEVSGLANGMYNVEVYLSASAAEWNHTSAINDGDQNTSITVNDVKTLVGVFKRTGVSGPTVVTLQNVMVKDGKMNFTITNDKEGANWVIVAHKSITMTGKIDNTALQNRITTLKAEANGIKGSDMNSTIKTNLNIAINAADATSEDPDALNQMIESLEAAIAAANPSIADYAKLKRYIAMTKVFTDVTEYETQYNNGTYTSENVDPVRKELNIARYNAASEVFPNPYEVKGWTGDLANVMRSDQHWSGQTIQYYDANSWTPNFVGLKHTLSTTVTLPEGTYVLKAAGRSSEDATLRLNIKNGETVLESVEYTGKGDTGYGIDTEGNANFSEEATYANEDKGRGWEWEFAKFELDAEATVTLHVEVDYNSIQNRFGSFSDITLWMDDKTYVTVYGKELDAPLAEAKALVNTLPMGANENTALANAITMGEGELSGPTELNDAVKGLQDAVKDANEWRNTYYTEKDKLVAALERFEADYNDAENGALDYMNKNRWSTVIEKAQAAAVAKDNRTSHEGLTTATTELIAALDAATTSVNEYSALDAAIKTAKPLYEGGNWGDQPFQRPISAKESLNTANAQAVYNAATADGEGVTSVTEALNNGLNGIVLNAPAEGARYNMVMDYAGWEHHGKAVTYLAGGRQDAGMYNIQYYAYPNANYAQAFTFTAVEGQANCYTLSMTDVDGKERYVCTGTVYGGNASQIRTTTEADKALAVKVIATATGGVHQLWNTEANDYIGGQDAGFFTVNSHTTFRLQEAAKANVTLTLSKVGWATLILPFDAELKGVKAWSCGDADGETLNLVEEVESLKANTPYLMSGNEGTYTFSGYGLADKDSYTEGLFTGTYVEYQTMAGNGTYVLQNIEGDVAFYRVNSKLPKVGAYRCYMTYDASAGAPKFSFGRGEGTTSIDNMESTANSQQPIVIYDLMGRKVNTMEKGGMYIVNGKKVIVK